MKTSWSKNQVALAKAEWDRIIGVELTPDPAGLVRLANWWDETGRFQPGQSTILLKEPSITVTQYALDWASQLVYKLHEMRR